MNNEVQLYTQRVSGTDLPQLEAWCLPRLHPAEQRRYQSFGAVQRRHEWLAGRALILEALTTVLGHVHADAVRTDERGKIVYAWAPLSLSLSHSRGMLALTIASAAVGVDVEYACPRMLIAQAQRIFTIEESKHLAQAHSTERMHLFYRYWTLKEAVCKAAGISVWEGLTAARFDLTTAPVFPGAAGQLIGPWRFWCAGLDADWQVAIAIRSVCSAQAFTAWRMRPRGRRMQLELSGLTSFEAAQAASVFY